MQVRTYEEFLLIAHTNLLSKIKNERLQPKEILEIYEEEFAVFWDKFGKMFSTELYEIKDNYLVEDTEINRIRYYDMVKYFKVDSAKLVDKISKRKFA